MNDFIYITPEKYIELCKADKTPHPTLKELQSRARGRGTCDVCNSNPIWKLAGTGMCFSCTTGETDNSSDYELEV